MRSLQLLSAAALLALASTAGAASLIDVQFSNGADHTQTGAAVTGTAGDAWNNFTTGSTGNGSLVDTTGAASGVASPSRPTRSGNRPPTTRSSAASRMRT